MKRVSLMVASYSSAPPNLWRPTARTLAALFAGSAVMFAFSVLNGGSLLSTVPYRELKRWRVQMLRYQESRLRSHPRKRPAPEVPRPLCGPATIQTPAASDPEVALRPPSHDMAARSMVY